MEQKYDFDRQLPHNIEAEQIVLGSVLLDPESIGSRSPVGEFGWDGAAGCYVCIVPEYELAIFYAQQIHCCGPAYGDVHVTLRELACDAAQN